jgi:hypothetical protein
MKSFEDAAVEVDGTSADTFGTSQRDHHMMMGMVEDPEDHKAVASAVFISVAVYAVGCLPKAESTMLTMLGFPCVLRFPSLVACKSESTRGNITMMTVYAEKMEHTAALRQALSVLWSRIHSRVHFALGCVSR